MRALATHDRPREKLERAGVGALGDNELVALIVGHGTARAPALEIAERLLTTAGGLHGLTRLTRDDLAQVTGVGAAVAGRLVAAIELGRRTLVRPPPVRERFQSAREAAAFLMPQFGAHPVERFGVMSIDSSFRLIRTRLLSVGSLNATIVHPREVFREATAAGAAAIIVFHNHPSGDPTPSSEDFDLTKRLISAGYVMGIDVIDHVILGDGQYCSMFQLMTK